MKLFTLITAVFVVFLSNGCGFTELSKRTLNNSNGDSSKDILVNSQATSSGNEITINNASANLDGEPEINASQTSDKGASLVSFSAGALIVKKAEEYDSNWSSFWLLDERADSGWATPKNNVSEQSIVIALPEKTVLKNLFFDTGRIDGAGRGAKDIVVEISEQSESIGFQQIANVSLAEKADNQKFPVSSQIAGRFVRLTVKNNHGSTEYTELFDFRATGEQLTQTPFTNVSGAFATNYGDFHLKQDGTIINGCYNYNDGKLNGGSEGRVIKFTWSEKRGEQINQGPAVMVFTPDGKQMFGLWWNEGQTNQRGGIWNGSKKSDQAGTCPDDKTVNAAGGQIAQDLEETGRARIYGINFDSNSDKIKPESSSTLDKIATLLKAKPKLQMTIEGHTDSVASSQYNQDLSARRAASVKNYLVTAGIDAARLKTVGFGATKPVADNATEIGRAQNRRVELSKQ